jgi:hypothetical protein
MLLCRGWRRKLEERDISLVIVTPRAPLAGALATEAGWSTWHRDSTAVIFRRSAEAPAGTD